MFSSEFSVAPSPRLKTAPRARAHLWSARTTPTTEASRDARAADAMAGVKPHTNMALNGVMEDQTVEAELATLVSEYLQFHRCTGAYEVRRGHARDAET